jgi:excisionase family DNA binding protein
MSQTISNPAVSTVVPNPFAPKLATSAKAAPVMVVADPVPAPHHEYLTLEEVAALLRCHQNSVRNSIKYNGLPAFRVGAGKNGAYRVARSALDAWLIQQSNGQK